MHQEVQQENFEKCEQESLNDRRADSEDGGENGTEEAKKAAGRASKK